MPPIDGRSLRVNSPAIQAIDDRKVCAEWDASFDAQCTIAETYLMCLGLADNIPPGVRFKPPVVYANDNSASNAHPGALIVAAHDGSNQMVGVHRTYIDRHGRPLDPRYYTRFLGIEPGATFRLNPARSNLLLTTSIPEALALRLLFPDEAIWSVFDVEQLRHVHLPLAVEYVTICTSRNEDTLKIIDEAMDELELDGISAETYFPANDAGSFNEFWLLTKAGALAN